MSQRNTAAARVNAAKKDEKKAGDKNTKKSSAGKAVAIIIIVLLLAITGYESYLLFGGDNLQATLAVITQGRSFLEIADEEMLLQKQNLANQQAALDQDRQDLIAIKNTLDKEQKNLDKRKDELDALKADLDAREQAILEPQKTREDLIEVISKMEDGEAAVTLMGYSDMNEALMVFRGLKTSKASSILAAMVSMSQETASKFAEQYPNTN